MEESKLIKDKEWNPFEEKCCSDCSYLKAKVTWWCTNKEAIEYRGTAIPPVKKCKFWNPEWSLIEDKHKTPDNGFIEKEGWFKRLTKGKFMWWAFLLESKIFMK